MRQGRLRWLALIFVLSANASSAETINYDTESCATETGERVFVLLSNGQAFGIPALDLVRLEGDPKWPDEVYADPSQPVGCPLHPIAAPDISIAFRPTDSVWNDSNGRPLVVRLIYGGNSYRIQRINLRSFERACVPVEPGGPTRRPLIDVSPIFQDCRMIRPDNPNAGSWGSYLAARPGTYPEYDGRRFIVHCWATLTERPGPRACETDYVIKGDVAVYYKFWDNITPPEKMIGLDQEVRAFIESIRTPEYDLQAPP